MTESEKYIINENTGKFVLKLEHRTKQKPPLQYIPRYFKDKHGNDRTLQDLGWMTKSNDYLVCYCNKCESQQVFIITKTEMARNQKGHEYVKGYWGFCTHCELIQGIRQ